jgi:TolB-like protein
MSGTRKLVVLLKLAALLVATSVCLTSCSTQRGQQPVALDRESSWTVLPFRNLSQTPMSAERVESLVLSALRAKSLPSVDVLPSAEPVAGTLPLLDDGARLSQAMKAARTGGYQYGVTGSVEEWRYKAGLDGEPAVGISIRVVDIDTGATLWSNSGARSGWSRESLTGNGQKVINKLLTQMFDEAAWTPLNMIR